MLSVCIPTFNFNNKADKYFALLLTSLKKQQGKFEIVVSDNSPDYVIQDMCENFGGIKYFRNNIDIGFCANVNNAIAHASYDKIKIMCQDDLLLQPYALYLFEQALDLAPWAVSTSICVDHKGESLRPFTPKWNHNILMGTNTIGMPSCTSFRKQAFEFDPALVNLADCDYYYQLHKAHGLPYFIPHSLVGQRYHDDSVTRQWNSKGTEYAYLKIKYGLE